MLRWPNIPENAWVRVCQNCMLAQACKPIAEYKSDTWRDVKCKRCKSDALDYGQPNTPEPEGDE
jgi:hypothetical protein